LLFGNSLFRASLFEPSLYRPMNCYILSLHCYTIVNLVQSHSCMAYFSVICIHSLQLISLLPKLFLSVPEFQGLNVIAWVWWGDSAPPNLPLLLQITFPFTLAPEPCITQNLHDRVINIKECCPPYTFDQHFHHGLSRILGLPRRSHLLPRHRPLQAYYAMCCLTVLSTSPSNLRFQE